MSKAAPAARGSVAEVQVVLFKSGGEDMALDINCVREILKIPEITAVPNAPDYVDGVINLRGKIKTVVNLKKRLGSKNKFNSDQGMIIITEKGDQSYGILVDSVEGVCKIQEEDITDPESILGNEKSDLIKGICRLNERLVIMLEPEELFSLEEIALS